MTDAPITLLCFPHAGAGRLFYERWRSMLAPAIEFRVAPYPHREHLMGQPMPASVPALAEQLYATLIDDLPGEFALWGHSMGSVVAYELAKLAQDRTGRVPVAFFSSGASAPCDSTFRDAAALETPEGIERILRCYGGVDEAALSDHQFMSYLRPILTGDLKMLASYKDLSPRALPCPLFLYEGEDDTVTLDNWVRYSTILPELTYFTGGHFFIAEHAPEVAATIMRTMASVCRAATH